MRWRKLSALSTILCLFLSDDFAQKLLIDIQYMNGLNKYDHNMYSLGFFFFLENCIHGHRGRRKNV